MVVLPVAAGEEEVGHSIATEDPMVAHVADVFIEGGDEFHAVGDGDAGKKFREVRVTFGAGGKGEGLEFASDDEAGGQANGEIEG